jgi:hypothetical protein
MDIRTSQMRLTPAAQQQHPSEDGERGTAVLGALASLTADPAAVFATVTAEHELYSWIWQPIIECIAPERPQVGRALTVVYSSWPGYACTAAAGGPEH